MPRPDPLIASLPLPRLLAFALAWWLISEGASASWSIGVPAVLIATFISARLLPPQPLTLSGLLRFAGYFLIHSLLGAVDVARRAFQPSRPLDPAVIDYPLRLTSAPARVWLINAVSLLPGTLSADLNADCLRVHVLDAGQDTHRELLVLERYVAAVFGQDLPAPQETDR